MSSASRSCACRDRLRDHAPVSADSLILDDRLSIDEVAAVAREHRPVALSDPALARIARGREVTETLLLGGERVYGLTTGVGALKRVSVGPAEQAGFNRLLLLSHRTGTGPDVPRRSSARRCWPRWRGSRAAAPACARRWPSCS